MKSKILIAYFSATGRTAQAANILQTLTKGDLYEIQPVKRYTEKDLDWMDPESRSSIEMKNSGIRPEIKDMKLDIPVYDIVFIGFPIWWYTAPMIIHTFLEQYDFSGKILLPFATSGGSPMGKTIENLKKSCSSKTIWKKGICFPQVDETTIQTWLMKVSEYRETETSSEKHTAF